MRLYARNRKFKGYNSLAASANLPCVVPLEIDKRGRVLRLFTNIIYSGFLAEFTAVFLIGLQFGASNLLPSMFQADVLEDMEVKTGKRLDASLPFVISIGTLISGTVASALAPQVLYGADSIIQYIQPTDAIPNPEQSLKSKILLLFFYTIVHGIMMFLAGVPFFFYKLTGKTKEEVHEKVLELRAKNK